MTAMNPDKDIIIEILKNLRLFRDLNYIAIKELTFLFSERVFQAGETIFAENDTGNSLQVILSGDVRISQRANVSSEETLTRILSARLREADSKIQAFVNLSQWI